MILIAFTEYAKNIFENMLKIINYANCKDINLHEYQLTKSKNY